MATTVPPSSPRRYDIVRHGVRGMKAPYLVVLQHHDVPSITRIIAPLTLPQRGDHDGVALSAISIFDGPSAEVFEGQSPVYQANGLS
jgi:hypothetical protein